MVTNNKPTGRSTSLPNGVAQGAVAAMALTLGGSAIIAKAVEMEMIEEKKIGYAIMVLLILVSWISGELAYKKVKTHKLLVCMASGFTYLSLLTLITAIFFGGQYTAMWETTLLVLCGSILAYLRTDKKKRRADRRRTKIRNC